MTPLLPEGGNEREGENRHSMSKWFWGGDQSELGKRGSGRAASHTVRTVEYRERRGGGEQEQRGRKRMGGERKHKFFQYSTKLAILNEIPFTKSA